MRLLAFLILWLHSVGYAAAVVPDDLTGAAVRAAIAEAVADKECLDLDAGDYSFKAPLDLKPGAIPKCIHAEGASFTATDTMPYVVRIHNPHGQFYPLFRFNVTGLLIDSNGKADVGLLVEGGQHMSLDVSAINAKKNNIHVKGDAGSGVYYNNFIFRSKYTDNGSGVRFETVGNDRQKRIAANTTWVMSSFSKGHGIELSGTQGTFTFIAERNEGAGVHASDTYDITSLGGHLENNLFSIELAFDAYGFKQIGGRVIDKIEVGQVPPAGFYFDSSTNVANGYIARRRDKISVGAVNPKIIP